MAKNTLISSFSKMVAGGRVGCRSRVVLQNKIIMNI